MADINQKHGKHVKSRPSDKDLTEADIIPASTSFISGQISLHNIVHLSLIKIRTHNISGDRH
jgi:hypothetical protein